MSRPVLEFCFDLTSLWSYLGFEGLMTLHSQLDFDIQWHPVLVGAVWNANNENAYDRRIKTLSNPHLAKIAMREIGEWAQLRGADIQGLHPGHPVNAARLMRAWYSADAKGQTVAFMRAAFEAYWRDHADIAKADVIIEIAKTAGLNTESLREAMDSDRARARLREDTQDLIDRGGWGTPTFFIKGDLYFGQDRLPLIKARLKQLGA